MRRALLSTICIAIAAAIGPASATAAPAPILDGDFVGGTATNAHVFGGDLYLNETIWENQDFATSPIGATWTATPWPSGGSAAVDGGALRVDGARVGTDTTFDGPQSLRFPATFADEGFEHVGLGTTFEDGTPWAMFSTGGGDLPVGLYARTLVGGTPNDDAIEGVDPTVQHGYEIRWTATRVAFYVDGRLVSTHDVALPSGLHIAASDLEAGGGTLLVDGVRLQSFAATGTFVSRPLATGPGITAWGALTATGAADGVAFETRTGFTPAPDASWSPWQPLGAGGAIASPLGWYVQYRVTLSSFGGVYGPRLSTVTLGLDADRMAPTARITALSAGRTTVRIAFASADADVARYECKLDAGAYQACTSPNVFTGLRRGAHAVAVRAIDRVGNAGAADTRTFATKRAPAGPKVTLSPRSVRVSRAGAVTFRVTCPRTARRCRVAVQLERGRRAASNRRAVRVRGGRAGKVRLRLRSNARRHLATHARLRVTAVVAARDAAGRRRTTRPKVTVLPRARR